LQAIGLYQILLHQFVDVFFQPLRQSP
jgi:hypothetical protein